MRNSRELVGHWVGDWFDAHSGILCYTQDLAEASHFLLGLGNGPICGATWLDRFPAFLDLSKGATPVLPHQRLANGQWAKHPWQPFAYAALAGLDLDKYINPLNVSLREIASLSTRFGSVAPEDFGHLTIAGVLFGGSQGYRITIDDVSWTVAELALHCGKALDSAVSYCWGFHLIEAILLAASRLRLSHLREQAERLALQKVRWAIDYVRANQAFLQVGDLDASLSSSVAMARSTSKALLIISVAGHAVELAGIFLNLDTKSNKAGYVERNADDILDIVCAYLGNLPLPFMNPRQWWLGPLAHLRRGIILLDHVGKGSYFDGPIKSMPIYNSHSLARQRMEIERAELSRISGKYHPLDELPPAKLSSVRSILRHTKRSSHYDWQVRCDPQFIAFRPSSWPPCLHFEISDSEGATTIEIHLENDIGGGFPENYKRICIEICQANSRLSWDPYWAGSLGRIRFPNVNEAADEKEFWVSSGNFIDVVTDGIGKLLLSIQ